MDCFSKLVMLMFTYVDLMAYFSVMYAMTSVALNTPQFEHIQQFTAVCSLQAITRTAYKNKNIIDGKQLIFLIAVTHALIFLKVH